MKYLANATELRQALADTPPPRACNCALGTCAGWESLAEYRWDKSHMSAIGTLRDPAIDEPSLEEHLTQGTRYDSANAPIATDFFPYNRCEVWHCQHCDRHLLRYTEFGGYNVDPRVRQLEPSLIVEPPEQTPGG